MRDKSQTRPNFILFITDQQRADFLGCNGHPVLRTPQIDAICARGTAFDRLYVASPVCMPNRSSLMTGRMPSAHGVRCNGIPLPVHAVTFVDLLRDAGYATALVGKSHLQNFTAQPAVRASGAPAGSMQGIRLDLEAPIYQQESPEFWADENAAVQTPFYGFDHVTLVCGHGDHVGGDYKSWLTARDPNAKKLLGRRHALPHDYVCPQAVRTAIPPSLYQTTFIGESAAAYLRCAEGERPFFLMVSFPDPHHPFNPPGRYWDMYAPSDFDVPEAFRRNDWTPPWHVRAVWEERTRGRANLDGVNAIGISAREAQEARALTCGMISCIDDAIGAVLGALDESGRRDDTVLLFTADHGDHLGDHGLLFKGAAQYQSILRVPFIWADPQAPARPARSDALASTIDIPATVLDRAGLAPYAGLQGRSLLPVLRGEAAAHRESVLVQYDHQAPIPGLGKPPRVHTIVSPGFRLSLFDQVDGGELYDLAEDPGEFENLWESAAHTSVRAALMEQLARAEIGAMDRIPLPTRRA